MRRFLLTIFATFLLFNISAVSADVETGDIVSFKMGKDQHGKKVDLKKMVGKSVVVYFWNPFCDNCLTALEHLELVQKKISEDDLEVVAVAIRTDQTDYRRLEKSLGKYKSTFVYDKSGRTARKFGVSSVDHMFMIDAEGKIQKIKNGYDERESNWLLQSATTLVSENPSRATNLANSSD